MEAKEKRFQGPNGEFVPSKPLKKGYLSIKQADEICEWVYCHDSFSDEEKLKMILGVETLIGDIISENLGDFNVAYVPTWSTKFNDKTPISSNG